MDRQVVNSMYETILLFCEAFEIYLPHTTNDPLFDMWTTIRKVTSVCSTNSTAKREWGDNGNNYYFLRPTCNAMSYTLLQSFSHGGSFPSMRWCSELKIIGEMLSPNQSRNTWAFPYHRQQFVPIISSWVNQASCVIIMFHSCPPTKKPKQTRSDLINAMEE